MGTKKEYLVEITKKERCWIEAWDEEEVEKIVEDRNEDNYNEEIDNIEILDVRDIDDDEELMAEYLNDYDDEE